MTVLIFAAGCGGTGMEHKTYRLLSSERAEFEAYTNPKVALFEEPEQADEIDATGKFIYLGWLSKEGILPGNPFRTTRYQPYRETRDKDLKKIDYDMWWIMKKRKERLIEKKKEEASRPRVISY